MKYYISPGLMESPQPWPERRMGSVTIAKDQGVLAALAAAGYSPAEAKAYYGQMIASGQIARTGFVQPGQELRFDIDDLSQTKLGGKAIAAESAHREKVEQANRVQAQQAANAAETASLAGRYPSNGVPGLDALPGYTVQSSVSNSGASTKAQLFQKATEIDGSFGEQFKPAVGLKGLFM